MKKANMLRFLVIILPFAFLLLSCEEPAYKIYTGNYPVYMSYSDLRSAVAIDNDVPLENPGKICFAGNNIFIVEELNGIHVYDNSDPSSPQKKAFVRIPGVTDISVSGNTLYADSYIDLVMLNIGNIDNITVAGRSIALFPYMIPVPDNDLPRAAIDRAKGVVTGWEVKKIRERTDQYIYDYFPEYVTAASFYGHINPAGASAGSSGDGIGTGGSVARFVIKGNTLYADGEYELILYDITNAVNPVNTGKTMWLYGTLTLSIAGNYLFAGTTYSSYVVDISLPLSSQEMKYFSYCTSCTPVIVDDTLAFITTRSGTSCGNSYNTLAVVDLSDLNNPNLLKEYNLTNPLGLARDGDLLFVCDGITGLKIFDASDPENIVSNLIKTYPDIKALNAVIVEGLLVLIRQDGLFQYDYSDVMNLNLLSSIVAEGK